MKSNLFLFIGQSNMAGRGDYRKAPKAISDNLYEFRAISDPTKLYPVAEPFGVNENLIGGIDDGVKKSGSLVTSFMNKLYSLTKTPIVGVSASKGGSTISEWQIDSNSGYLKDAINRLAKAKEFIKDDLNHTYALFLQGESDGDKGTSKDEYIRLFNNMYSHLRGAGVEALFLIEIGRLNIKGQEKRYDEIRDAQRNLEGISIVSSLLINEPMKDEFHFFQESYNKLGEDAAKNVAKLID